MTELNICRIDYITHIIQGSKNFRAFSESTKFFVSVKNLLTSSAADFGQSDLLRGRGERAGACAQGIWNSFTTRWLIIASTPAKTSIPCTVSKHMNTEYNVHRTA